MRKNWDMVIVPDDTQVDELQKIAANCGCAILYKIGVYGSVRQHELYVTGRWADRKRFMREKVKYLTA